LEIEGDSQILINSAKQLFNGAHANKVSTSWRLEARLEDIENHLNTNRAIIFNHVKRECKKVEDLLANMGFDSRHPLQTGTLGILQNDEQKKECTFFDNEN